MKLRSHLLALTVVLSSCALFHPPAPPSPEDPSNRFPSVHERDALPMGGEGQPFELDGVSLRALSIAANDFLPPSGNPTSCVQRQEAHRYRVLRQGDILFVRISLDPARCEHTSLDGGVKYAISTEGRILRRLFDGEPESITPEALALEPSTLVTPSQLGATAAPPATGLPPSWFDGGTPDASTAPDGGVYPSDGG